MSEDSITPGVRFLRHVARRAQKTQLSKTCVTYAHCMSFFHAFCYLQKNAMALCNLRLNHIA